MVDATRSTSDILKLKNRMGQTGRLFGEGAEAMPGLAQGLRRAVVSGSDDVAALAMGQSAAQGSFNANIIPGLDDLDNARDAGRAAKRHIKRKGQRGQDELDALTNGAGPNDLGRPVAPVNRVAPHARPVGDEGALFRTLDPVAHIAETGASMAGGVQLVTEIGLPAVGWAAGKVGAEKAKSLLNKPNHYLNPQAKLDKGEMTLGGHLNNGMMMGFSAIAAYGVAKGFAQNLDSLKHMYADMTGTKADNVSTMTLLTSNNVPDLVKQARRHFLQEHVSRGAVQMLSIGLIGRSMFKKKPMGVAEFLVPMGIGLGVDVVMGESTLPFFAGVANAYKSGQELPPQAYAEFLLAASSDLKRRGPLGRRMAMVLGEEYAAEKASPGAILQEIESSIQAHKHGQKGKFDERIGHALATAEALKAGHGKQAEAKTALHQPQDVKQESMVERIGAAGRPRDVAVQGKFTQKLKQEMSSPEHAAGNVIVP